MIKKLAALAAASFTVGCMSAHPTPPPAQAAHALPEDRHVYRVDFVVAQADPGKPEATTSYTLNLEDLNQGQVHVGANVPLTPAQARMDVGLKIKASVRSVGRDIVLRDDVEVSSIEEGAASPTSIHKISTNGDAVLRDGQPALVASLEDPLSHRRYRITAAATLIR